MKRIVAGTARFGTIVPNGALELCMSQPYAEVKAAALELSRKQRIRLAEDLLASVEQARAAATRPAQARSAPALKRTPPDAVARAGWAEAARAIAAQGGDELVMGEFANDDDTELRW